LQQNLNDKRDTQVAKRFFRKALNARNSKMTSVINADQHLFLSPSACYPSGGKGAAPIHQATTEQVPQQRDWG